MYPEKRSERSEEEEGIESELLEEDPEGELEWWRKEGVINEEGREAESWEEVRSDEGEELVDENGLFNEWNCSAIPGHG